MGPRPSGVPHAPHPGLFMQPPPRLDEGPMHLPLPSPEPFLLPPGACTPNHGLTPRPRLLCAAMWGTGWFIDAGDIIELSGNSSVFMAVTMTVFKEVH